MSSHPPSALSQTLSPPSSSLSYRWHILFHSRPERGLADLPLPSLPPPPRARPRTFLSPTFPSSPSRSAFRLAPPTPPSTLRTSNSLLSITGVPPAAAAAGVRSIDVIEIRALRAKFREVDADGTGVIDSHNFARLFGAVMQLPDDTCDVERACLLDFAYGLFDASGSQKLHVRDFIAGCVVLGRGTELDRLRYLFQMYDRDKSGTLSVDEVERIFHVIRSYALVRGPSAVGDCKAAEKAAKGGVGVDARALARRALADFDIDRDGMIRFEEFALWCEKEPETKAWLDVLCSDTARGIAKLREERERAMVEAELADMGFEDSEAFREGYSLLQAAAESSGNVGSFGAVDSEDESFVGSLGTSLAGAAESEREREHPVALATPVSTDEDSLGVRVGESNPGASGSTLRDGDCGDEFQIQRSANGRTGPFEIDFSSLTLIAQIGEGSFARVWSGKWLDVDVAVKILKSGKNVALRVSPSSASVATDSAAVLVRDCTKRRSRIDSRIFDDSEDFEPELCSNYDLDVPAGGKGNGNGLANPTGAEQTVDMTDQKNFLREIGLLTEIRHPNIILLFGACTDPRFPQCIVSELVEGGSLQSHLKSEAGHSLSMRHALKLSLDIARGMLYLHSGTPMILHRDLKAANILVENFDDPEASKALLIDFGLSRLDSTTNSRAGLPGGLVGSLVTMAPEVMRSGSYGPACDVYSFGIVTWQMAVQGKREPFQNLSPVQLLLHVSSEGLRPEILETDNIPPAVAELIVRCWAQDPDERPTFNYIVKQLNSISSSLFGGG